MGTDPGGAGAPRLQGKRTIVTGGGSGVGRATSRRFAREGARVLIVDLVAERADAVAEEIATDGGDAVAMCADVSHEQEAERIVARAEELWGGLDVLVNNAAIFTHKRVDEATREDWEGIWSVNVLGTSFCSKHAVFAMRRQAKPGTIVNVASINGLMAAGNYMTYNATKAAIINMTKAMALDLAEDAIRVNCVCPGVIDTPALADLFVELGLTYDEGRELFVGGAITKRFAQPEEIASAILFLASDEASYVNAAAFVVDGGHSA